MNTAQRTDKTSWLCVKCEGQMITYGGVTVNALGATRHLGHDSFMSESARLKATLEMSSTFLSSQGIFSTNPSNLLLYVYI